MPIQSGALPQKIVAREEWLKARKALLKEEKELTRLRDKLNAKRRELPWVKVEKQYIFDTPDGKKTLSDLFDGRSQLIVHHFMFHPDWDAGCKSCSFDADHAEGALVHLENHDVSYVRAARAPLEKIEAYKKRMGWRVRWCRPSAATSTTTTMSLSRPRNWRRARCSTTTGWKKATTNCRG